MNLRTSALLVAVGVLAGMAFAAVSVGAAPAEQGIRRSFFPFQVTASTSDAAMQADQTGSGSIFNLKDGGTNEYTFDQSSATFVNPLTISAGGLTVTAGQVDVGDWLNLSQQTAISVTAGAIITPTGTLQLLESAGAVTTSTTTPIASGTEAGDLLILRNTNASDAITIDGTGGTVECKANVALGAQDTLTLVWNGADWVCIAGYDNS